MDHIMFSEVYRDRRALRDVFGRQDLSWWGRHFGPDGVQHQYPSGPYLPKSYPAVRGRKDQHALDLGKVRVGDLLELHGNTSGKYEKTEWWVVESIDDDGIGYRQLSEREVARFLRGEPLE